MANLSYASNSLTTSVLIDLVIGASVSISKLATYNLHFNNLNIFGGTIMVRSGKLPKWLFGEEQEKRFLKMSRDLLEKEGYAFVKQEDEDYASASYLVKPPNSPVEWLVRFTVNANPVPASNRLKTNRIAHDLSLEAFGSAVGGTLVLTSFESDPKSIELIGERYGTDIWDLPVIKRKVGKFSQMVKEYDADLKIFEAIQSRREDSLEQEQKMVELREKLENISPGRSQWREYEDVCVEILKYAFSPHLQNPRVQPLTTDRLQRRDFVFGIKPGHSGWERLVSLFQTRVVVGEFKNLQDRPGQNEVSSIHEYLSTNALRTLGFLCSRKEPSNEAYQKRETIWRDSKVLVLFFSDTEMLDLLQLKASGEDPMGLIEYQIDEFFTGLSL
jgi:hypothetical protein